MAFPEKLVVPSRPQVLKMDKAHKSHPLFFDLDDVEPRFVFDKTNQNALALEYFTEVSVAGIQPNDHIVEEWRKARDVLTVWVKDHEPDMVLMSGNSAARVFGEMFISDEHLTIANVPVVPMSSYDLYGHLFEFNESLHVPSVLRVREAIEATGLPHEDVLVVDDKVYSADKAYNSWYALIEAGVPHVTMGAISARHKSAVANPLGSDDHTFYAWMFNMADALSFLGNKDNKRAQFEVNHGTEETELLEKTIADAFAALRQ